MDDETIQTYNKLANEYDQETIEFWENFPREFIAEFKKQLKGNLVLSIGSGPGRDALLLKNEGVDVTCLDASQAMVEMCSKKGFVSIQGDLLKLPFRDASFDGVWSYTSFLHVPRAKFLDALKKSKRVLKSDGVLALGLIEGETESYKTSSGVSKPRLFTLFTLEEIRKALKEVGFTEVYVGNYKPRSKNYLNIVAIAKGT